MFKPKVVISDELMEKLKLAAAAAGCASVDEFAAQALDDAAEKVLGARKTQGGGASQGEVDDIAKKLKGLGYLE